MPLASFEASAQGTKAVKDFKSKPATAEDSFTYSFMGTYVLCRALQLGIEFPKAIQLGGGVYATIIKDKHEGKLASAGGKVLTDKQILDGAASQVIMRAGVMCPKELPKEILADVNKNMERMKKQMEIK